MITPEQAQKIKAGLLTEKTTVEVAADAGVAKSTVERVNRLFIKKGKFGELLEKAERMASLSGQPKKAKSKKHSKKHRDITPSMVANMKHLRAQGLPLREVAEKLGLSSNTIWYHTSGSGAAKETKKDKLNQKIFAMREKGITVKDIAKKLGVTHGLIHSRVYAHGPSNHSKESTNGASSSNVPTTAFSRDIRIGIAFAEVERFIGVLSERLGEPAKVLRPRLSELLGHSPLREPPGNGD